MPNSVNQILRVKNHIGFQSSLTINGNGAMLISTIWNSEMILFYNNQNVTLQNFMFEHDPLPYVDGVVQSVDLQNKEILISKARGMNPLDIIVPGVSSTSHFGWLIDPIVNGQPKTGSESFYKASQITHEGGSLYKFSLTTSDLSAFEVGDRFTYNRRLGHNVRVNGPGENYHFRWLISYSSNAFMFYINGKSNPSNPELVDISDVTFTKVRVELLGNRWRSINGDGIHINNVDNVTIDECYITGNGDDGIAFNNEATLTTLNWNIDNCLISEKRRHAINVVGNSHNGSISNNNAEFNGGEFIYLASNYNITENNNIARLNNLASNLVPFEHIADNDTPLEFHIVSGEWFNSSLSGNDGTNSIYSYTPNARVKWTPTTPMETNYKVYYYKIVYPNSDSNHTVTVVHRNGVDNHIIDLTSGSSGWVYLGEYELDSSLNDHVYSVRGNNHTRADAIKLVK